MMLRPLYKKSEKELLNTTYKLILGLLALAIVLGMLVAKLWPSVSKFFT